MRIFVSEYICSGALAGEPLPPTLAAEGRAMWRAVIEDLSALHDVTVTTTRDARIRPLSISGVEETLASTPDEELAAFREKCSEVDAIVVIAPEIGDQLSRRIAQAHYWSRRATIWNVPLNFSRLASDKFATWQCFVSRSVPTIPTSLLHEWRWNGSDTVVIKPRFGAGSQDTFLCRTSADVEAAAAAFATSPEERQGIVQPFVAGRRLSCLVFVNRRHSSQLEIQTFCPPGEQYLSDDGRFQYLGGVVPVQNCDPDRMHGLTAQAIDALQADTRNRPQGPIGFDFIESSETGDLLIVDVNPRFTTSYLAYRQLATGNLLAFMAGRDEVEMGWRSEPVFFSVADFNSSG
jgi:tyramine---L-glutamate ligase